MARADFIKQLKDLGYEPRDLGDNKLAFDYIILVGKFIGQQIQLGFVVGNDFPSIPPSGPHITPHLLPIKTNGKQHPSDGIHPGRNGFGTKWQYWSRPFPKWKETDKTVKTYLAFINHLFETQ